MTTWSKLFPPANLDGLSTSRNQSHSAGCANISRNTAAAERPPSLQVTQSNLTIWVSLTLHSDRAANSWTASQSLPQFTKMATAFTVAFAVNSNDLVQPFVATNSTAPALYLKVASAINLPVFSDLPTEDVGLFLNEIETVRGRAGMERGTDTQSPTSKFKDNALLHYSPCPSIIFILCNRHSIWVVTMPFRQSVVLRGMQCPWSYITTETKPCIPKRPGLREVL